MSPKNRVLLIEKENSDISVSRQAELLGISHSSVYYLPVSCPEDTRIMNVMDEIFTACPFYGSRRMRCVLERDHDIPICRERVQRLMRLMGVAAIYPKKARNTSLADKSHRIYPYLLTGVSALHPNHIWGTDITYIRLETGWCYLAAIIDWYSRKVIAWTLSATMEQELCIQTLEQALTTGSTPEIHNSDQGSQFTAEAYRHHTPRLDQNGIILR